MTLAEYTIKPQEWTLEDIRYRLTEAADTLRSMPVPHRGFPAGYKTGWPDVVYEWTAYGYTPATARRSPPTAIQIDKLDETLGWLHWLERDQRMILWARAHGWTWRQIEELDKPKHRQERQLRTISHDGERRIMHTLNGVDSVYNQRRAISGGEPAKISIAGIAGKMV
jgi:hypothetical protein